MLFPIGENGGKERNIAKAYETAKKKFRNSGIEVEVGRYRCSEGRRASLHRFHCGKHGCQGGDRDASARAAASKSRLWTSAPSAAAKTSPSDIRNMIIIGGDEQRRL